MIEADRSLSIKALNPVNLAVELVIIGVIALAGWRLVLGQLQWLGPLRNQSDRGHTLRHLPHLRSRRDGGGFSEIGRRFGEARSH